MTSLFLLFSHLWHRAINTVGLQFVNFIGGLLKQCYLKGLKGKVQVLGPDHIYSQHSHSRDKQEFL